MLLAVSAAKVTTRCRKVSKLKVKTMQGGAIGDEAP